MSTISFFGTLVDTIRRHYELPEISSVTLMPSLRSHAAEVDSVYRITTISESYVLRPFRNESLAATELHNQFLGWAEKENFSMTQRIIQTRTRQNCFASDRHQWWLSSYIEADPVFEWTKPTWTTEDCQQSGRALSRIHQALLHFAIESPSSLALARAEGSVVSSLEKRLTDSVLAPSKYAEQWQLLAPLVSNAIELVKEAALANKQLVHGDYHPGNLLFSSGVALAVIDFEYLNIESPMYDLAYALVMFCTHWIGHGRSDGEFDLVKLQSFLSGYLSEPAEFDPDLLLAYMKVATAICLTWFLERELEDRTVLHFVNVLKQLENFSTMDISVAIGRA